MFDGFFLSRGFRPFFLLAGLYAMLSVLPWLGLLVLDAEMLSGTTGFPMLLWHGHEMLFGYTAAVVAGFLLTAVPNWTQTQPVRGLPLAVLALVWIAGRAVLWFGAGLTAPLVAIVDLAFLPVLAALLAPQLWRHASKRSRIFLLILAVLLVANLLVHLERIGVTGDSARTGMILALDMVVLLLVIIGGRVIPTFTGNVVGWRVDSPLAGMAAAVNAIAIPSIVVVAAADLLFPGTLVSGLAALIAGAIQALRMIGWQGAKTLRQPILWVLHLGYAWVALGLLMKGIADITGWLPPSAALHGLTVGAIGTMTLGVMTRASLGHTGRPIAASPAVAAAYLLPSLAALSRILGPELAPEFYAASMALSGLLWISAFATFSVVFWPILMAPRIDGQPG